ncbi:MAG: lipocalin family protein [Pyrinomonadaceae bacterium]
MTTSLIVITMIASTLMAAITSDDRKGDLEVVDSVDLSRYAGRWYEIARLPNRFEKKCADSVTADYALRPDGRIEVVNRCRKTNGEYTTAKGKAKIVDQKTNAKLKVTFFWPFYGDYWILDLGPNYEYAVVGDPSRDYLWILSRAPRMDEGVYQQLLVRMRTRGFKTERMIRTLQISSEPQPGQARDR